MILIAAGLGELYAASTRLSREAQTCSSQAQRARHPDASALSHSTRAARPCALRRQVASPPLWRCLAPWGMMSVR